jgi:predicted O-linked N-acetylglucosamine transferase (SPINDLY family)
MDTAMTECVAQATAPGDLVAALELTASGGATATALLGAQRALRGVPLGDLVAAIERTNPLPDGQEERLYRAWIAANAAHDPGTFAAWFNLGAALARDGARQEAAAAYGQALALRPDFAAAAVNLGLTLEALGDSNAALSVWQRALQPDGSRVQLLNHRARLCESLYRLDEAEAALRASLATDPRQPDAWQHLLHVRQKMCAWPILPPDLPTPEEAASLLWAGPLATLALTDDIAVQCAAGATFVARKTTPSLHLCPPEGYRHSRIRLGYLSSDFCRHAMSYLIAEVFERHDRGRFEVFGYCIGRDDGSEQRTRVLAAFDHVRLLSELTDADAAAAIRADEIDILIDLNGLTRGARPQILRWRPAPVQATYLGFVGPVPAPELDYLLCDEGVVPPGCTDAYQPTPLPIGPIYQPNDTRRGVAPATDRAAAGLPPDRFVFCCFAGHFKITKETFAAWIEILRAVPDSVLWLPADNAWSVANLSAAAVAGGVLADRLIFAPRVEPERYMARLALADLFLDTFPYNAGTVASDALRMGLPLLTLSGRAFASRMAGQLLTVLGAPEGIATTLPDYVRRAIRFATDPLAHADLRSRCAPAAWHRTLGDMAGFMRCYEATLAGLVRPGR